MYILKRSGSCESGTFGFLWIDEEPCFVTIEPPIPIIPPGIYTCVIYTEGKHPYPVFLIQNVPGHSYVEIHIANSKYDTDGCLGIGYGIGCFNHNQRKNIPEQDGNIKGITFSSSAFTDLMKKSKKSFELKVE